MAVLRQSVLALWCSLGVWIWLTASPRDLASEDTPRGSQLVAIPVDDGIATFDIPASDPHDQYLILVSSLAGSHGPFSVEISASVPDTPPALTLTGFHAPTGLSPRIERCREELQRSRRPIDDERDEAELPEPPRERTFWLMVRGDDFTVAKNYEPVRAVRQAIGRHCTVYVDEQDGQPRDALAALGQAVIETFDGEVCPKARRTLGRHRDVDGDGRFTILLTHWLGQLCGGSVSVGGFVRGSDFYPDIEPPLGNRCDMMYLNSSLQQGPHLRTLIAHEYTHAITLSEHVFGRYLADQPGQEEESWLDESIAHLVENLHGYSWSNLDYRISAFLNSPERYRLVVDDYYAADLWRGHGNRGSTYLFLRWCVDQFGETMLRDLVQTNLCGVENIEASTGRPFAELYRVWSAALFLSNSGLATSPEEEVRFLNLRSALGGRMLAGPRYEQLELGGDSRRFALTGTSTKFLVAHSPPAGGSRIRVVADRAANLQVSLRRLPRALARLELNATPAEPSAQDEAGVAFELRLTEHNDVPVSLEQMCWERTASGSNNQSDHGCCGPMLHAPEIERLFGATRIDAGATLTARLTIPREFFSDPDPVLKLAGHDAAGHAVTAWCTLPANPLVRPKLISAQRGDSSTR